MIIHTRTKKKIYIYIITFHFRGGRAALVINPDQVDTLCRCGDVFRVERCGGGAEAVRRRCGGGAEAQRKVGAKAARNDGGADSEPRRCKK